VRFGKDSTFFSLLQARRYEFDVERAVYLTVLVLGSRAPVVRGCSGAQQRKDTAALKNQGTLSSKSVVIIVCLNEEERR
jgi:hypothetical protein